jgi:hypothetical protein
MASEHFERALAQGRVRFMRHEWVAAHDAWEEGARLTVGDERALLQGLVLWAAGAAQHLHAHTDAARRLLLQSLEHLNQARSEPPGVDTEGLHDAVVASLEALGLPWAPTGHRWPEAGPEEPDLDLEHRARCPYCGEPVLLVVAAEDARSARYVEDCPVCCRPWDVQVHEGNVTLGRDDGPA